MRKDKINTKYILICIATFLIAILAIFSYTLKTDRELSTFESLIKDSVIGASRIITLPFKYISDEIKELKELKNIKKEYDELKANVDRIDSLNAENIELRNQLDSMKEELDIKPHEIDVIKNLKEVKQIIDTFIGATFHQTHIDLFHERVIFHICLILLIHF